MENLIKSLKERNEALKKDRTLSWLGRESRIAENKRTIKLLEQQGHKETPEAKEDEKEDYSDYLRNN